MFRILPTQYRQLANSRMAGRVNDVSFLRDFDEAGQDFEESSDQSTVQMQQEAEVCNNFPAQTVTSIKTEDRFETNEDLGAIVMNVMKEVSKLRAQLQDKVENEAESVTSHMRDEEDCVSISSANSSQCRRGLQPLDHGRWKASKAAE